MSWTKFKVVCRLVGHDPAGPINPVTDREALYRCRRCQRVIRFRVEYPNGWEVLGGRFADCCAHFFKLRLLICAQ